VKTTKRMWHCLLAMACLTSVLPAFGAQLGGDARSAIPMDIQQLIVIDYRAMQNSPAAMQLRARVMPPELKQLESALKTAGLNEGRDVDQLAFASFRISKESTRTLGVAQGQFSVADILASFRKQKVKPTMVRTNRIYPMGASGLVVTFLNQTTMVFGSSDALKLALDARDGLSQSLLNNQPMIQMMQTVDQEALWSVLDQRGTQMMMHSVMGDAAQLADYDTVKKRLLNSAYTMNFQNGVKFNLYVTTPDSITAATMSSLLNAAMLYKKMNGSESEKQAINETSVNSDSGRLLVQFAASDGEFSSLLQSPLFQTVVQ
jgi:hypothetical protein